MRTLRVVLSTSTLFATLVGGLVASGCAGEDLNFYRGTTYERYDLGDDQVDSGYPAYICGNWPGLPF